MGNGAKCSRGQKETDEDVANKSEFQSDKELPVVKAKKHDADKEKTEDSFQTGKESETTQKHKNNTEKKQTLQRGKLRRMFI